MTARREPGERSAAEGCLRGHPSPLAPSHPNHSSFSCYCVPPLKLWCARGGCPARGPDGARRGTVHRVVVAGQSAFRAILSVGLTTTVRVAYINYNVGPRESPEGCRDPRSTSRKALPLQREVGPFGSPRSVFLPRCAKYHSPECPRRRYAGANLRFGDLRHMYRGPVRLNGQAGTCSVIGTDSSSGSGARPCSRRRAKPSTAHATSTTYAAVDPAPSKNAALRDAVPAAPSGSS